MRAGELNPESRRSGGGFKPRTSRSGGKSLALILGLQNHQAEFGGLSLEIFFGWLIFAIGVAVAATARGRSGGGWFLLSPLVGLILVLLSPNLRQEQILLAGRSDAAPPRASIGGHASRVTVDRTPGPFEPDGVLAGFPYRVADDGSIEAIMQGAKVKFRDFEKFTSAINP